MVLGYLSSVYKYNRITLSHIESLLSSLIINPIVMEGKNNSLC